VQRVRDEAHRFAVTYHRQKRSKATFQSRLDDIPGVGPKRKKAMLKTFGSLKGIREASIEELTRVEGINQALAEQIKSAIG
jgi:excinuclease ABC subunit C